MKEVWSRKYGKNTLDGIHVFLSNHIMDYKRSRTQLFVEEYYKTIDASSKLGYKSKVKYISTHFKAFRDWFFSLNRVRIKGENPLVIYK